MVGMTFITWPSMHISGMEGCSGLVHEERSAVHWNPRVSMMPALWSLLVPYNLLTNLATRRQQSWHCDDSRFMILSFLFLLGFLYNQATQEILEHTISINNNLLGMVFTFNTIFYFDVEATEVALTEVALSYIVIMTSHINDPLCWEAAG